MLNRLIELPPKASFFLLGPRQTGKSTLIRERFQKTWTLDLLLTELYLAYSKDPSLFRKEAQTKIQAEKVERIFIDEIQRVPLLLNEVQALMNESKVQFILTGSSARKLKRGGANLLAGRAVERQLFPLTHAELQVSFDLNEVLHFGSLPPLVGKSKLEKTDILTAYTHTYLQEEIQAEGISRNLGGFSRFLDLVASQCGEIISFSATARECHLPVRTVQSYYEVLEDTLVGLRLPAWSTSHRRRLVSHPKFYLFDTGVTNAINKRLTATLDSGIKGRLFEQWLILETYRLKSYHQSEANLYYWRTNHGAEVDLLIEKHGKLTAAVEIKSTAHVSGADLSGIRSFREEYPKTPCYVVSQSPHAFELDGVKILPWTRYLKMLEEWI